MTMNKKGKETFTHDKMCDIRAHVPTRLYIMVFGPGRVIPSTIIKVLQTASLRGIQAFGSEFDSAVRLCKRPGSVWN